MCPHECSTRVIHKNLRLWSDKSVRADKYCLSTPQGLMCLLTHDVRRKRRSTICVNTCIWTYGVLLLVLIRHATKPGDAVVTVTAISGFVLWYVVFVLIFTFRSTHTHQIKHVPEMESRGHDTKQSRHVFYFPSTFMYMRFLTHNNQTNYAY